MKKCVIVPDSFKGTLSSLEVCEIISTKIREFYSECEIIQIPVADGGEGTVDCFLHALKAQKVYVRVTGPYNESLDCYYARKDNTAIIEMAQAAGLPLVENRKNPAITTTYGVGMMIRHAVENGCTDIVIGLGGSCTNDAGVGAACALGAKFYDKEGNAFIPTGNTLHKITTIDIAEVYRLLENCSVTAMCDIDNPMFGENGAAYIFAPQKGADTQMVAELDYNLRMLSDTIINTLGTDVSMLNGAGAAGAMGAGIVAFLGGSLKSGIHTVLDIIQFEQLIENADIIFTGEGKIDGQSLRGKVVIGVAERASRKNIPVVAVVGAIGEDAEKSYAKGVSTIFSINRAPVDFSVSRYQSKENLAATIDSLLRFYNVCRKKEVNN
jgi:glycerate kinase